MNPQDSALAAGLTFYALLGVAYLLHAAASYFGRLHRRGLNRIRRGNR